MLSWDFVMVLSVGALVYTHSMKETEEEIG